MGKNGTPGTSKRPNSCTTIRSSALCIRSTPYDRRLSRPQLAVIVAAGLLAVQTVACENPPDDDAPGQAPTSVEPCDPDVERCEP